LGVAENEFLHYLTLGGLSNLFSVCFLEMIPLIFHFPFWGGNWKNYYNLCLLSAFSKACAQRVIVYYDVEGHGADWNVARSLPNVEWQQTENDPLHRCATLFEHGGFYCTLEMIFLKSFEILRHNTNVVGLQCQQRQRIHNAVMGSVPESQFIADYAGVYDNTPNVPSELCHPNTVTVLKRAAFFPVAISNTSFWAGQSLNLLNTFAIYLWSQRDMSLAKLEASGLSNEIQNILHPELIVTPVRLCAGICSFD